MDIKQAFEIVKQVCEMHVDNWQTHQQIQEALKAIAEFVNATLEKQE